MGLRVQLEHKARQVQQGLRVLQGQQERKVRQELPGLKVCKVLRDQPVQQVPLDLPDHKVQPERLAHKGQSDQ